METTEIGGRSVPVLDGPKSVVTFTGGAKGAHEAGRYAFWFAVYRRDEDGSIRGHVGRALEHLPPGERFNRHPDNQVYDKMRENLKTCECVAPAVVAVIEQWLADHRKDAAFATDAEVGGKKYRVDGAKLVRVLD